MCFKAHRSQADMHFPYCIRLRSHNASSSIFYAARVAWVKLEGSLASSNGSNNDVQRATPAGLPVGVPSLVANGQISSSRSCPRSTSGNKVYYLPDIKTLTMDLSVKTSNYRHLTAKTSVPQRQVALEV
ncbi:hypothetical protein CIHG_01565 [Coccidioides immitis H538.4]|uniref:Uncharacterized protein n=3 Tax=Coccidioides immitis TaxID=5501 RepID=A0A0J8QTQ5_COCIT|nr:hypothetical protein CIRG_01416 [Coccidioides immitis RMSCC 2394]KMU75440.1 hypothetical protein CISG_05075 [Coccidioides immitis RMSCC 3703]KMU83782.1 hypothetical protein CIHG_01565 [Coccidioides immitis H538.4]